MRPAILKPTSAKPRRSVIIAGLAALVVAAAVFTY